MSNALFGFGCVLGGCQINVFLLELIIAGSPNTVYALTFVQYVAVALLALPFLVRFTRADEEGPSLSLIPLRWRRQRIPGDLKLLLAMLSFVVSVGSNVALDYYISVPLHATVRSTSLILNMLAGYLFLHKRFTRWQVLCAVVISAGLVALAFEKSRKAQSAMAAAAANESLARHAEEVAQQFFWWCCGVLILIVTTAVSVGLGIFQEFIFTAARKSEAQLALEGRQPAPEDDDAAPMWLEAVQTSYMAAIPFFFFQPHRLRSELLAIQPSNYTDLALNCITQLVCISGVYVMNDCTSAFTLTLTITLRKLASFTLSVLYFRHYLEFSLLEWVAMVGALFAGAAYPFVPKAAVAVTASATTEVMKEETDSYRRTPRARKSPSAPATPRRMQSASRAGAPSSSRASSAVRQRRKKAVS